MQAKVRGKEYITKGQFETLMKAGGISRCLAQEVYVKGSKVGQYGLTAVSINDEVMYIVCHHRGSKKARLWSGGALDELVRKNQPATRVVAKTSIYLAVTSR